jgi:ATP-dependent Lhr-like helicase
VDEFDLPALRQCLEAVEDGDVVTSIVGLRAPSPFAANLSFGQINRYMYADDTPETTGRSRLADELIRNAVEDAAFRPALARATVDAFLAKRQRTAPGYEPGDPDEWLDWIKERVLIPAAEFEPDFEHPYLVTVKLGKRTWYAHRERLAALLQAGLIDVGMVHGPIPDVADVPDGIDLALELLSFYGPQTEGGIRRLLPRMPAGLLHDESLVRGPLLADDAETRFCERSAFEALLRLQRALARPDLEVLPASMLAPFLMGWTTPRQTAVDAPVEESRVAEALAPLLGYGAPVRAWLEDLPACRIDGYRADHLERWMQEQGLMWQGCGRGQIRIGYPEDLILAADTGAAEPDGVRALFTDETARYGFLQLADRQTEPLTRFNEQWWAAVWRGEISADSLTPLRQALTGKFRLGALEAHSAGATRRARPGRRGPGRGTHHPGSRAGIGWPGNWMLSPQPDAGDPLSDLEDARDRARMLLDRYGVVCRELANREGGPFRWRQVFRALRIMELAGEVVAGLFFEALSGPQFALPDAVRRLSQPGFRERSLRDTSAGCFWMSALDPASPCGLGLPAPPGLPPRREGNYLSFHGADLALVVESHGKRLDFRVPAEHPELGEIVAPVRHLLSHRRRVTITSINGDQPAHSPYRPALEDIGRFVTDHRHATLECR